MIRRRLIIEWDDEGTDTDEDCAHDFVSGRWSINDLSQMSNQVNLKVWVEDAKANELLRSCLKECLSDYSHPNFTDRRGQADRIKNALDGIDLCSPRA